MVVQQDLAPSRTVLLHGVQMKNLDSIRNAFQSSAFDSLKQIYELSLIETINHVRGENLRGRSQIREHEYRKFLVKCCRHALVVGDHDIRKKLIKEVELIDNPHR